MGRYYYGSISGKFWVGIQPSNDVENLCDIGAGRHCLWIGCGCIKKKDAVSCDYCDNCYDSLEDHIVDAENGENKLSFNNDHFISYELDKNKHSLQIKNNLMLIETQVDTTKLCITFSNNKADLVFNIENERSFNSFELELLARYCFGKHIMEWFEKNDTCSIVAEL